MAKSENGWYVTPPIPVYIEAAEVRAGEWHSAHPTKLNSACPFSWEGVEVVAAGGADILMNAAKLTMSDDIPDAVPVLLPDVGSVMLVASSGVELKTQPATAERSFGNSSLLTPISTL